MNVKNVELSLDGIGRKLRALKSVIVSMLRRSNQSTNMSVESVESHSVEIEDSKKEESSVQKNARKNMNIYQRSMMPNHVQSVEDYLHRSEVLQNTAQNSVESVHLVSIVPKGKKKVYNFETEGTHTYVVGNGIVVHNCDNISQIGLIDIVYPSNSEDIGDYSYRETSNDNIWANYSYDDDASGNSTVF